MLSYANSLESENYGLTAAVPLPFQLPTSLYGAMLAIWHSREDLQKQYPLHKGKLRHYIRFLAWCATYGRKRYKILLSIPAWDIELQKPIQMPMIRKALWSDGFSVAQFLFGIASSHFSITPVLKYAGLRKRIAINYWKVGRHKYNLPIADYWQLADLKKKFNSYDNFLGELGLKNNTDETRYLADIKQFFESKETGFDSEQQRYVLLSDDLCKSNIRIATPVLKLAWLTGWLRSKPSHLAKADITQKIPSIKRENISIKYRFGVNLYGYAQGELGIGEDVRLVAKSLESQGIPFCIINIKPGKNVSQMDSSVDHWIVDKPRYAINIFCTTGMEQVTYACLFGMDHYVGRYNIGYWPWELPEWPTSCGHAYDIVDEIWGISHYTANAYRKASCPVYAMSLPVTIDNVALLGRKEFKLPEDDYLFVFSFDFNSTLIRKNPEGVIRAFIKAFPQGKCNDSVGLVIKISHSPKVNLKWRQIKRLIDSDKRVYLIAETLRRPEVLALYKCCDCFVSLHRAEGFGRGLAEALLLDLQVIATGFSGNLDFCREERVGLVQYQARKVLKNQYFNSDGLWWAEPNIEHAAELMREIYNNPKPLQPKTHDFSPETSGKLYAERLNEIKKQLKI